VRIDGELMEIWPNEVCDMAKGELEVDMVEKLFTKIRNDFGKTLEEERKVE